MLLLEPRSSSTQRGAVANVSGSALLAQRELLLPSAVSPSQRLSGPLLPPVSQAVLSGDETGTISGSPPPPPLIAMLSACVSVSLSSSATSTVKFEVPLADGVPLMTPP